MKRLISLILVLSMMLCACGSKPAETTAPPTTVPETTVPETTVPVTTLPETVPTEPETLPMLPPEPESDDVFVRVLDYIPTASQQLMYATENNFTGQVIYDFTEVYLRWGTVKKLQLVAEDLAQLDLYLKIWDGFRPVSAQFVLWEVCPNPTYVANPNNGYSSHSRGNTIDLTLVDTSGQELEMPTAFDDFSAKADRDYSDCTPTAANNAQMLEILMEKHGFTGYSGEWWHFSDVTGYPVEQVFEPEG